MKTCSRCKLFLDEESFNWKVKHLKRATYCKKCSREYIREHYLKNAPYYIKKAKKRNFDQREFQKKFIGDYLLEHPCIDCGESDILVLEFDHKDQSLKLGEVSVLIRRKMSLSKIKEEIKKCEVRCANCHRRKTAIESNS